MYSGDTIFIFPQVNTELSKMFSPHVVVVGYMPQSMALEFKDIPIDAIKRGTGTPSSYTVVYSWVAYIGTDALTLGGVCIGVDVQWG